MSSAKITLIGLYQYLNGIEHKDLFEGFENLPESIETDLLIDNILMRGGEYEVLYPDPDFMQDAITSWSKRYAPVVSEWVRAEEAAADVAPLENYDRIEDWADNASSNSTDNMSGNGSTSGTDNTSGNATTSGTDTVSAYDSSTLVNDKGTSQTNTTQTASTTSTTSTTQTASTATNQSASTHSGRVHGNIGVTTSATMWREWMDVVEKYGNIYEAIATIFLQNFVIPLI